MVERVLKDWIKNPEGPARRIDVSRQKLSPHCLEAIFDSQLPSQPNCLLKCLPNCLSPTREGFLSSFKINPAVRVIARQVRDKKCLAAIFAPRHQSVSSGPLGRRSPKESSSRAFITSKGYSNFRVIFNKHFQGYFWFSEDFSLLVTFLLVTFSWLFCGPHFGQILRVLALEVFWDLRLFKPLRLIS